ncbi:MAG: hypothetical protein IPP63_16730 [Chloracidobacterium sp.]|nr:hypothetical protein [Chloracidobacterium sp.]
MSATLLIERSSIASRRSTNHCGDGPIFYVSDDSGRKAMTKFRASIRTMSPASTAGIGTSYLTSRGRS